jgi:hypothetical protein
MSKEYRGKNPITATCLSLRLSQSPMKLSAKVAHDPLLH